MFLRNKPSLAAGKWTQVAGCCASVNVPLESINKELAIEQAPSCQSLWLPCQALKTLQTLDHIGVW
jgi:hypothetical protein